MPDYRDHIAQARELLELAARAGAEGRAAVRSWAQQVADALPPGDEPDAVLDPAEEWRAAQVRAAQALGYTTVALSETGPAGIELYPDDRAAGHYDDGLYPGPGAPDNGGHMQYDAAAIARAQAEDEVARYGLMLQSGRPARPQYAGLPLSQPAPDEADDADLVLATPGGRRQDRRPG
jgi:hypothetical protein